MTGSKAFVTRHGLGIAAAAVAVLAVPYVASGVSWRLSQLLGASGGMHVYSVGWSSPERASLAVTLGVLALLCMGADALRLRFRWLSWFFPVFLALFMGVVTSLVTVLEGPMDAFPSYAPLVIGVTFVAITGVLVGSYWATMLATADLAGRMAGGSWSRRTRG